MLNVVRALGRALSFYALTAVAAAVYIALAWLLVTVFPFFFERTKGLWELIAGVEGAQTAVVGLGAIVLVACLALTADLVWRRVMLGPRLGAGYASNMPRSWIERAVVAAAFVGAAAVIVLLPGAWGAIEKIGSWLPENGTLGLVVLSAVLAIVAGSVVYAGDLVDTAWRYQHGLR